MMALHTYLVLHLLPYMALSASHHGNEATWQPETKSCAHHLQRLKHDHVVSSEPPVITGEWTSQRCEVRSGPEYILRKYSFYENGQFELVQYFYSSADCWEPIFSIVARGRVNVYGASWIVPGATEMDYTLSYVTLTPYSQMIADALAVKVNSSCQGHVRSRWRPYERHEIYNFVEYPSGESRNGEEALVLVDRDCLAALELSFHELQLMRVDIRRSDSGLKRSLYVGDIHTDRARRMEYRPSSFQPPLLEYKTSGCPVCRAVSNSDEFYPPALPRRRSRPLQLAGTSWTSTTCETGPHVLRLTRHLQFHNDSTWEAVYQYFYDNYCQEPKFSLHARGSFTIVRESPLVTHSYEADFVFKSVRIAARDEHVMSLLNHPSTTSKCGNKGQWRLNQEQDVTNSKGCAPLGVSIAPVDLELLRVDQDHRHELLFLGEKPTDPESRSDRHERPTSFRPPLTRCDDQAKDSVSVVTSEEITRSQNDGPYSSASRLTGYLLLSLLHAIFTAKVWLALL